MNKRNHTNGIEVWLRGRQAAREGELASRVGDADIDSFLKNVKIQFPTTKRTARRVSRGGGSKDDPFSGVTDLGDVSQGGGDEILDNSSIQRIMMANYRKLVPCIMEERRRSPGVELGVFAINPRAAHRS